MRIVRHEQVNVTGCQACGDDHASQVRYDLYCDEGIFRFAFVCPNRDDTIVAFRYAQIEDPPESAKQEER